MVQSWRLLRFPLPRQMRELWHENVTTFLGFFVASGVSALVLEYCARGSLEDLLRNEALRLDWTFKASLLLDLIRVRTFSRPGAVGGKGDGRGPRDAQIFPRPGLFPLCLTEKNLCGKGWGEAGRFPGVPFIRRRPKGPPRFHSRWCGTCTSGISRTAASNPETAWWTDALC